MLTELGVAAVMSFVTSSFFVPTMIGLIALLVLMAIRIFHLGYLKSYHENRSEYLEGRLEAIKQENANLHKSLWAVADNKFTIFISKEKCDCEDWEDEEEDATMDIL